MKNGLFIHSLRIEYRENPIGIDEPAPRFSWKLKSSEQNTVQSCCRIVVTGEHGVAWDSGFCADSRSSGVVYAGEPLLPFTRYEVSVTVRDQLEREACTQGFFETGVMQESVSGWNAKWIGYPPEQESRACLAFSKSFSVDKPVRSARLYATACGIYEAALDGKKAGDAFMAPGWTSYHHRIQYQAYDLTEALSSSGTCSHELLLTAGNGWYRGFLGFADSPDHFGKEKAVLAMLRIVYEDGSVSCIGTDESWSVKTSPILTSEIYYGETQDYTKPCEVLGQAVRLDHQDVTEKLSAQHQEPVRITKRFPAVSKVLTPKGEFVIDFGQNLAGFVEVNLPKSEEGSLVLYHAEALDKEGNFYPETLRSAVSRDEYRYTDKDTGKTVSPHFTFHGFRYIRAEGIPFETDLSCFTACALHTDMEKTGSFTCDNPLVERLVKNIEWSQRSNFLDVPTDCPQRNERLGWTGDAQVFSGTAAFQFQTELFFEKWLADVSAEQTAEYGVPHVVPNILGSQPGAAAWSDCAVIIPWNLYQAYGDIRILEKQYGSMKGWVDYVTGRCRENGLWMDGHQYGDWLGLDAETAAVSDNRYGATDRYLVANIYYANSADIVAKAARVLGKKEDAERYEALHSRIIEAIRREYVTEAGRLVSETQTACVLMLHFGILEEKDIPVVLNTLEKNLGAHRNHLVTGFTGTPYICLCLSAFNRHDLAEAVFLKEDCPGWLYAVKQGATTIWERWDSIKPDGSFDTSGMNSLNHYANGSIGEWLYRTVAGISPAEPGYRKIRIAPTLTHGMTRAEGTLDSPYGIIRSAWTCKDRRITVDIEIPANTTAELVLPEKEEILTVGSGCYHFEYPTETRLEQDRYTMETTLGELVADPEAATVINSLSPGMLDSPMIQYAFGMTVSELSAASEDAGAMFKAVLQKLNQH